MNRRPSLSRVAVTAFLFFSSIARAQQPSSTAQDAASELYGRASREMEAGDYARACPRLEAAKKILPEHVRTGMTLAQCYELAGQPASAWAELMRVKLLAEAQGKADKTTEISNKLSDLELRVPRLTIEVPADLGVLPGLVITRNGTPIGTARWGKAEPVDPGVYEVGATALGKEPWTTQVEVKEAGKNVPVKIAPPWVVEQKKETRAVVVAPPPPPVAKKSIALIAGGAGLAAAGLGMGVGFHLVSNGKSDDAQATWDRLNEQNDRAACRNPLNAAVCDELRSAYDGKELFRSVAIGGYVAGGVLAVGTLAYALLPTSMLPRALLQQETPKTQGMRASVSITPSGGGAVLQGTF